MKRRLPPIATVLAVCTLAGAALAGVRAGVATAVAYDSVTDVLTATSGETDVELLHSSSTEHAEVVDPQGFPPGPCKRLAFKWNMAVHQDASMEVFEGLLTGLASNNCEVAFLTGGTTADGTLKLTAISPAKP